MPIINEITCPFQRAALLVARWSGARRDEIRHLPLDCLDHYPDGTPRLRLPGRKTYKERMVPLHQDAGHALQKVIDLRKNGPERPFADERTGEQVRYLFMDHGKLLSLFYLFNTPIQQACEQAGLVVPGGKKGGSGVRGTISAHRFRHTVGTQLAERGAKLHTIMKVLGHSSVSMALVYAQISDREVLRDYKSILAPGAVIAGPAALDLKSGVLPDEAVHWLKTNFFKTELELGHCLRLPAEGPCECDLYLTCAKSSPPASTRRGCEPGWRSSSNSSRTPASRPSRNNGTVSGATWRFCRSEVGSRPRFSCVRYQAGREPSIGPAQLTCPNTGTGHSDQSMPVLFALLFLEGLLIYLQTAAGPECSPCPPPTGSGSRSAASRPPPGTCAAFKSQCHLNPVPYHLVRHDWSSLIAWQILAHSRASQA